MADTYTQIDIQVVFALEFLRNSEWNTMSDAFSDLNRANPVKSVQDAPDGVK